MTVIRRGEPSDLQEIARLQADAPEAAHWNVGEYLKYDLRVAILDGRFAGFLVGRALAPGESEILNLAVSPEFRRQGIACELVKSFLRDFPGTVFLELRASNRAAFELYKYLQFQEVSIRPDYYESPPEPAIVMKFHSC